MGNLLPLNRFARSSSAHFHSIPLHSAVGRFEFISSRQHPESQSVSSCGYVVDVRSNNSPKICLIYDFAPLWVCVIVMGGKWGRIFIPFYILVVAVFFLNTNRSSSSSIAFLRLFLSSSHQGLHCQIINNEKTSTDS